MRTEMLIDLLNCSEVEKVSLLHFGCLNSFIETLLVQAMTGSGCSDLQIAQARQFLDDIFQDTEYPQAVSCEKVQG